MKICLVGDFSRPDEARKVMAPHLLTELSKRNDVRAFHVNRLFKLEEWKNLRAFQPDVIHYIPGASPISFFIVRMMKLLSGKSKTVTFAAQHPFHGFSHGYYCGISTLTKNLIPLMKTDLMLVQSGEIRDIFTKLGCKLQFFVYSGVDVEKYQPVTEDKKRELREKYGVDTGKYIVLHVGSIKKVRNVNVLKDIQKIPGVQVVLVGRNTSKAEDDVFSDLNACGIKMICDYTPYINELYALADCYVFPTVEPFGSIDVPLSVIEALAAGLPVVTTEFGGLPDIFMGKDGVTFAKVDDFAKKVKDIKDNKPPADPRSHVLPYSWGNIALELETIYKSLQN